MHTKFNGVLLHTASTVALLAGLGFTTQEHKVAQEALTTDIRNSDYGPDEKDDILEALEARKTAIDESDTRTVPGLIENIDLHHPGCARQGNRSRSSTSTPDTATARRRAPSASRSMPSRAAARTSSRARLAATTTDWPDPTWGPADFLL